MGLGCVLELAAGPARLLSKRTGWSVHEAGAGWYCTQHTVSQKSRVGGGGGVCPGKGQLPLPGVQRTQLALAVFSQGVWEPSCHSALKGNALRVEGNHIPSSGFHRDGRQAAWLLPVSAKCDCNRRTFMLWVILPVAV